MKFVVEQHSDSFVAYPLGMKGVVVGQGNTRDEALADAISAARFHHDTFGNDAAAEATDMIDDEVVDADIDD